MPTTTTTNETTTTKVPVTERALIQRINRKLAKENERLRRTRARWTRSRGLHFNRNLGEFYVVDTVLNVVAATDVDVEEYGRELGALRPWEAVAE